MYSNTRWLLTFLYMFLKPFSIFSRKHVSIFTQHWHWLIRFLSFRVARLFWRRWKAVHTDLVGKVANKVSINRALNCTCALACKHLDDLAQKLIILGIFTNAAQENPGVWTGNLDTSRLLFCYMFNMKHFVYFVGSNNWAT